MRTSATPPTSDPQTFPSGGCGALLRGSLGPRVSKNLHKSTPLAAEVRGSSSQSSLGRRLAEAHRLSGRSAHNCPPTFPLGWKGASARPPALMSGRGLCARPLLGCCEGLDAQESGTTDDKRRSFWRPVSDEPPEVSGRGLRATTGCWTARRLGAWGGSLREAPDVVTDPASGAATSTTQCGYNAVRHQTSEQQETGQCTKSP